MENGRLAAIYLQLHETVGMKAAWGSEGITPEEFAGYRSDTGCGEGMLEVAPDYALALIRDAIYRSGENDAFLPSEFYIWRCFAPGEIIPEPYTPAFTEYDLGVLGRSDRLVADSAALFDDDFFAGWGMVKGRVCDYAEEWVELEKMAGGRVVAEGMESLLARFCDELLVPELAKIQRRLFLTADLMRQTCREKELLTRTLAVAASLDTPPSRLCQHPFLRRLALESMDLAREALVEGYDVRLFPDDDAEWE